MKNSMHNHPLHPALVHFPIACWSLATVGDIASLFIDGDLWKISGILLAIGSLTALLAMLTGLLELVKIDEHSPAMRVVNMHMILVIIAWCFYTISLFSRYESNQLTTPGLLETGLSLMGFVFLCAAGWLGATLVYSHKVGVKR